MNLLYFCKFKEESDTISITDDKLDLALIEKVNDKLKKSIEYESVRPSFNPYQSSVVSTVGSKFLLNL